MKIHCVPLIVTCGAASVNAFTSLTTSTRYATSAFVSDDSSREAKCPRHETRLYISSWGRSGPPSRWKKDERKENPAEKIQAYLTAPEPVAARSNLDGTVLVSGWVRSKERTDQTVFDFLNSEESAFKFEKIVAFVDDAKFARKRLLGRSARYTGLLDKLDFVQAESEGGLPTHEQLVGVKSWVANVESADVEIVKKIGELFKGAPSVQNLSVLMSGASSVSADAALEAVKSLEVLGEGNKAFTIVAVGKITESEEGKMPYQIRDFGTKEGLILKNSTFGRDESLRLVTECLGLQCGANKAMTFTEVTDVNQTESKLIKGLREAGYSRPQEIDHMITKGAAAYLQAIEDYKVRVPEKTPEDDWMATKQKELEAKAEERKKTQKQDYEAKKQKEIEDIAREWAKREYFRKSMAGDMPYSENEYVKSVWDRALFEGDLKYRMMHGQATDERKELAEFKKKQEKKKATMLDRAKASLQNILDSDDSDIGTKKITAGSDDDDDDDEDDDDDV